MRRIEDDGIDAGITVRFPTGSAAVKALHEAANYVQVIYFQDILILEGNGTTGMSPRGHRVIPLIKSQRMAMIRSCLEFEDGNVDLGFLLAQLYHPSRVTS